MEDTLSKINIKRKCGKCLSWYEDSNNILKGQWGGFEIDGPHNYRIFYSHYGKYVPITDTGLFYNIFDCRKYDGVINIVDSFYITEKNDRYGIVDQNEKVILHNVYKGIELVDIEPNNIFVITTETGKFLFNLSERSESDIYEDILWYNKENYIFKLHGKHGLLNRSGEVILPAQYDYDNYDRWNRCDWRKLLKARHKNLPYHVFVENSLIYGKFDLNNSVTYIKVELGSSFVNFFITLKDGKYGIINNKNVVENIFDDIIFHFEYINFGIIKTDQWYSIIFVIAVKNGKYCVYDAIGNTYLIDNCDKASFIGLSPEKNKYKRDYDCISFEKDNQTGYITTSGKVLDHINYSHIEVWEGFFYVVQNGKCGLLYDNGEPFIPCLYDKIEQKNKYTYILTKDGKESTFDRNRPNFNYSTYEPQHYDRYGGAYGYSDEDIDTIFDGNPDAYWNID